jgi:hypothetical protein
MVKATDALWDAQGGHKPTVIATTTQRNRSLLPLVGSKATKGTATPIPKAAPLPAPISIPFKTLAMACANFTITLPTRLTGVFHNILGQKTELPLNPFRFRGFSGHSSTCHCHGNAFFR